MQLLKQLEKCLKVTKLLRHFERGRPEYAGGRKNDMILLVYTLILNKLTMGKKFCSTAEQILNL